MFMLPSNLPLVFLLQATYLSTLVSAATNFSVDDQNPLFLYTGNWTRILGSLDKDGGHMMTQSQNAFATITYTFASVYYLSALWPYVVTTDYGIDGNTPMTVDMQDHSVPTIPNDGSPTIAAGVVGKWTSHVNQEHTIHITVPPGGPFGIVDMFIFEVLDPSDISDTITVSSTTTVSISTSTTSGTGSPSSLPVGSSSSSSAASSPSLTSLSTASASPSSLPTSASASSTSTTASSSSSTTGPSSTQVRNLAISMSIVGTLLSVLLIFLLWWLVRRRNKKNSGNMNSTTPHYHPVPTTAITPFTGYDGQFSVPLNGDTSSPSSPMGIQSNHLQHPSKIHNHYPNTSSLNGLPSTFYTDQVASSLPRQIPQHSHGQHSTASIMSDSPPVYTRHSTMSQNSSMMLIGRKDTSSISDGSRRPTSS